MPRRPPRSPQQLALPQVPLVVRAAPRRKAPAPLPRGRRRGRRSLQLALPQVPLALREEGLTLPGLALPPAPLAVLACVREGSRLRVRVVSGGRLDALVLFDRTQRVEGARFTVETLIWIAPRRGRGYYRAAGAIRRLQEAHGTGNAPNDVL